MNMYRCLFCVLCIAFLLLSGCTSLAVGDVTRDGDNLVVHVTNPGSPVEAGLQVRVYRIDGVSQEELTTTGVPASLSSGANAVTVLKKRPGRHPQ